MSGGLRVRLLGGFEVEGVSPRDLGSRKQRTFLKVLALARGAAVPVDVIADALWGDEPPSRPADQVAVLASRSRQVLGGDRVVRTDAGYALRADWLDVAAAEGLAEESARRLAQRGNAAARAAATAGLALFRGPLLPDEPDAAWCESARAAAARTASRLRLLAAEATLAAGDAIAAADLAEAALDADPYDEAALRVLMTAAAVAGRPATGLAAYERTRVRLDDDLGVRPAPETAAVHLDLLRERVPSSAAAAHATATLPGRADALARLDDALETVAAQGIARLVAVDGEAGMGKTRLLATWCASASERAVVLDAKCHELGRDLPLQPVLDALGAAVRGDTGLLGDDAALLAPLLGLAPYAAYAGAPGADSAAQPQVFAALLRVVAAVAGGRPCLVALDDAHVADAATLGWLTYARARATAPLLLVVARRVEEGAPLDADETVALGPLDIDAAREAVGDRAETVYERSGGHPLFLVELARAEDDDLPASLRDAVLARADRAGNAAATLRAAAVLGPEVDLDLLAAVLDRPPATVLDDLEAGVRRQFLDERGARFAFRHALVREALAASATGSRRALLHREAARVLAARRDAEPMAVAYHARLAGDVTLAARSLADAAAIASARFDHEAALALLNDAIALADDPALRRARARVALMLSRYADAAADATVALAADPVADSLEVAAQVAYYHARDYERAASLARDAASVTADDAQRSRCLAFAGRALHAFGDLRGADDVLARAAAVPGGATLPEVLVWTGSLRMHQGDAEEAARLLGMGRATDDPLPFAPIMAALHRGLALAHLGRPREALAELDRTDAEAAARSITRYGGRTENCRGFVLRSLAAFAEADEWNVRGAEGGRAVHQPEPEAHAALDLADGRLLAGDVGGAAARLDAAAVFQEVPHSYRWGHALRLTLLRGRLAVAARDLDAAEEYAAHATDLASGYDRARYVVLGRLLTAQVRLLRGDPVDRDAVAEDLVALGPLAGMDAWRVTYDLAAAGDVAAWRRLAQTRVERLAAAAGPRGDALRDYARRLDSTTIRGRSG